MFISPICISYGIRIYSKQMILYYFVSCVIISLFYSQKLRLNCNICRIQLFFNYSFSVIFHHCNVGTAVDSRLCFEFFLRWNGLFACHFPGVCRCWMCLLTVEFFVSSWKCQCWYYWYQSVLVWDGLKFHNSSLMSISYTNLGTNWFPSNKKSIKSFQLSFACKLYNFWGILLP